MKTLRYRGSGTRTISATDWDKAGVKSKEMTVSSMGLVEVNDAAAAWLFENESADWQELNERDAEKLRAEQEKQAAAQGEEEG